MNGNRRRWLIYFLLMLAALAGAVLLGLSTGTELFLPGELLAILRNPSDGAYPIVHDLRLPRILMAIGVGGALSLSGLMLQGIFRNPLVEPYTLGISGGAALGVALVLTANLYTQSMLFIPAAGFIGSLIALVVVYRISTHRSRQLNIQRMLLTGVMISFICSSAVMFILSTSDTQNMQSIIFWTMGSLEEPDHRLIRIMLAAAGTGLVIAYAMVHSLNALRLGEIKARHAGVNTARVTRIVFVLASLLTGLCVSVAGIIGFVGLLVPHIVRSLVGGDFRILLVTSFLGGGIFLIISDVLARTLILPNELPIGVITGILGGILFISVLSVQKFKTGL